MRRLLLVLLVTALAVAFPAPTAFAQTVGAQDDRVTDRLYVRHDGGTDASIESCNDDDPANPMGAHVQNNEPFSVVSPTNPDLVIAGWNDYCSDWMGLGFSTDGGTTWTDSLVPGYPADTSDEGMASPVFGRGDAASDPVGGFDRTGEHFYFGAISFNQFAGRSTNSDVWVARYDVLPPDDEGFTTYPLDYVDTTLVGKGPPAANFFGIFHDKEMIEVDRTGGEFDGNVYECWTKFPGFGTSRVYVARSTDAGETFTKDSVAGNTAGQGCDIAVEADGDVYVSWRDFETSSSHRNFGLSVVRSGDGGLTFSKPVKIAEITGYNPFDTARDCGDGTELCPSEFVFARVPLEPRLTSDPTGELEGVFSVWQASDLDTIEPSDTSYSSTGPGTSGTDDVAQGAVYVSRSIDDGQTWGPAVRVSDVPDGHQFFPDADALAGRLAVMWQDSRTDPCYDVQLPIGDTEDATSCGTAIVDTFVAVSEDGVSFDPAVQASSVANQPQYEMFANRQVPFYGDYNWIQLVERPDGSLFGYLTWTDNRDVVTGTDPREEVQDGFDVHQCRALLPDGTYGPDTCPNAGGLNQNIYGNSVTIP